MRKKTIIERMCSISEKMRPDQETDTMPLANVARAQADVKVLARMLGMTPTQAVLLTAIVRKSSCYRIDGDDVASVLGMEYLKFLTYNDDVETLRKRGYIRIDSDGHFSVPKTVMKCLKENRPLIPAPTTGLDAFSLLTRIKRTLSILEDDQLSTEEACEELDALMELNPGNSISRGIRKYGANLFHLEKIVLYGLVFRFHFEEDDLVGWHDLDDYVTEDGLDWLKGRFRREQLRIQQRGIIEFTGRDGLINKDYFHLTAAVKEDLFADTGGVRKSVPAVSASRKLAAEAIARKELFYNPAEGGQVARLKELLSGECFDGIRAKMKEKGLRSGFTCLFYGAPGTGKTETVYQIARESGRDLFIVDISQIKSCWVGESEKNIKEVFDKYRRCVSDGGTVPILLFNEADAIFGIRAVGAERAVDKMENAIQNIILQEMEDLDGILIATTNLTSNLDKAFERRFLYKVRFGRPSPEARVAIWQAMIPSLSRDEAGALAAEFDFSGGQIENVVRKREVKAIIGPEEPTFEDIRTYCEEETIGEAVPVRRRIGF